jgi:hypothetical protein
MAASTACPSTTTPAARPCRAIRRSACPPRCASRGSRRAAAQRTRSKVERRHDARRILVSQASHVRRSAARTAPLYAVIQAAAGLDADIRALAEDGRAQRIRGMRVMAQALADRGALKPGLTPAEAADVLWLLIDPGIYHRLVIEQHWDPDRYQDWLADALISLLLPASYQPKT